MPHLRDSRRPEVRPLFPLLLLSLVLLFTFAVAASPASAWEDWRHDTATQKSSCSASGCHSDGANPANGTNAACVSCHTGYTTAGGKKCWDCHQPGSAPAVACSGSCHLFALSGEDFSYPTAFTHGESPHLGATGYGKTCADCHKGGIHHDAATGSAPTCAKCHDGTYAKVPPASHNDGQHTDCQKCHGDTMSIPSCAGCHVGNASSGGPQVTYTNSLGCDDAGCHAKIKNHAGTPISQAACTECHTSHYSGLGTCTKCHADPQRFHHGTSTATPLEACATCHDGSIARAPSNHTGFGTDCVSCHSGMDRPSLTDCASCHVGKPGSNAPQVTFTGSLACADAGCHAKVKNHAGTPIATAECTTCHEAHYKVLGSCATCHTEAGGYHHGSAKPIPLADCAGCHDGRIAATPKDHESYGTECATCHKGMDVPSGQCMTCHDKAQGKVPAVKYSNDLSCGDASCHGKVRNHKGTSIAKAACTTCHDEHYKTLGTCATCHGDATRYHHGTTEATPLTKCETCHDGKTASARQSHAGVSCSACHDDMAPAPVPAACNTCHAPTTFGTQTCTACHSKASGLFGDKEQVHAKDPSVACTTCHKPMYTDVGSCDTCHESRAAAHHGTAAPAATSLTAAVSPKRVKKGARTRLSGTLTGASGALAGQRITVQARTSSKAAYKTVATPTTRSDGGFSLSLKPAKSTQYRVIWRAAGGIGSTQQPAVTLVKVTVRRR